MCKIYVRRRKEISELKCEKNPPVALLEKSSSSSLQFSQSLSACRHLILKKQPLEPSEILHINTGEFLHISVDLITLRIPFSHLVFLFLLCVQEVEVCLLKGLCHEKNNFVEDLF